MASGYPDYSIDISGILAVPNGGTGQASFNLNAIPLGNGSSAMSSIAAGTGGQVLAVVADVSPMKRGLK
jgi:hypothetical protein